MTRHHRPSFIRQLLLGAVLVFIAATAQAATDLATPTGGTNFDYAWLKGRAKFLAEQAYVSHEGELPKSLQKLTWDQ